MVFTVVWEGWGEQGNALKERGEDDNFFFYLGDGEGAMFFDRLWFANWISLMNIGELNQLCSILERGQ